LERPVDLKKLRVEGDRMNHALERPIDHKKLTQGGRWNFSCVPKTPIDPKSLRVGRGRTPDFLLHSFKRPS
jgi:hypothetical protein